MCGGGSLSRTCFYFRELESKYEFRNLVLLASWCKFWSHKICCEATAALLGARLGRFHQKYHGLGCSNTTQTSPLMSVSQGNLKRGGFHLCNLVIWGLEPYLGLSHPHMLVVKHEQGMG